MNFAKKIDARIERLRKEIKTLKTQLADINPYEHPKWVYPHRRREVARSYFTWELLNGTDVEKLKEDSCWKYYEQD